MRRLILTLALQSLRHRIDTIYGSYYKLPSRHRALHARVLEALMNNLR